MSLCFQSVEYAIATLVCTSHCAPRGARTDEKQAAEHISHWQRLPQASLTCAATGPVSLRDVKAVEGAEGREVFSEKKGAPGCDLHAPVSS